MTPELVKYISMAFEDYVLELFTSVWDAGVVPKVWADAVLVAIPKTGDLSFCDNWRGISLLDVLGKAICPHHQAEATVSG